MSLLLWISIVTISYREGKADQYSKVFPIRYKMMAIDPRTPLGDIVKIFIMDNIVPVEIINARFTIMVT